MKWVKSQYFWPNALTLWHYCWDIDWKFKLNQPVVILNILSHHWMQEEPHILQLENFSVVITCTEEFIASVYYICNQQWLDSLIKQGYFFSLKAVLIVFLPDQVVMANLLAILLICSRVILALIWTPVSSHLLNVSPVFILCLVLFWFPPSLEGNMWLFSC